MPIKLENQGPRAMQRISHRPSGLPSRPLKNLVMEDNISHASKPISDPIPKTPSSKILNKQQQQQTFTKLQLQQQVSQQEQTQLYKQQQQEKLRLKKWQEMDTEIPILDLVPFSQQPTLDFGQIEINQTSVKNFVIRNKMEIQQQVYVRSFPKADKGFVIDATEFLLAPKTLIHVTLSWTPKSVGSCRESITFQDINRMPRRIVIIGSAVRPKPEVPARKPGSSIPRFARRTLISRISPTKLRNSRRAIANPEKTHIVFSPIAVNRDSAKRRPTKSPRKPLARLVEPSQRRDSALFVRKMLAHRDGEYATRIQSYFRMILAKRQLERLRLEKLAAIKLQSYFRMYLAKRQLVKLRLERLALIKIQSYCRMMIAKRQLSILRARQVAAIKIQSYFRMHLAKRQLAELRLKHSALVKIQSYFRMLSAKRELARLRTRQLAAIKLQSYGRMYLARRQLEKLRRERIALIKIQSYFRMMIAKRELAGLKSRQAAAIKIQSYFRMYLAKRQLVKLRSERLALIKVQSYFRMIRAKRDLAELLRLQSERLAIINRMAADSNGATVCGQ